MFAKKIYTLLGLLSAVSALLLLQCTSGEQPVAATTQGKTLAAQYCQSCHLLPEPALLTKEKWRNGVLPVMGLYLGMNGGIDRMKNMDSIERSVLPAQPLLDTTEWRLIREYYIADAPARFVYPVETPPPAINRFSVKMPSAAFSGTVSVTSYAKIDTSVQPTRLFIGNAMTSQVEILNPSLQLLQAFAAGGAVVDMDIKKDKMLACVIGREIGPTNTKEGKITDIEVNTNRKFTAKAKDLFDNLARPVQLTRADLNLDGRPDYIICEFGNLVGQLSWMESSGNGQYVKRVLARKPGALRAYVQDCNRDGLPDIWVQFAQADESIILYTNNGDGEFVAHRLLRFPPSYGSTYFELVDFNQDGFEDILYTCGDNADYSQELKPYHGVYIFLNDGRNNFRQQYFYRVNGCYKAIAKDFDSDGDMDIAAVSFFPAAATPWEAFTYLENKGKFNFQPFTLPTNTPFQKGVTMDAGDIDGDGNTDLLLGSGYFTSKPNGARQPLFIALMNRSKNKP